MRPWPPVARDVDDLQEMAHEIRKVARFFKADLCGITAIDLRWHDSSRIDTRDLSDVPIDLPEGLTSVIVLGHEMEAALVDTYPSATGGATTGRAEGRWHECLGAQGRAQMDIRCGEMLWLLGQTGLGLRDLHARLPFNRDVSRWSHRLWLRLALSPLRRLAQWADRARGGRTRPGSWWSAP